MIERWIYATIKKICHLLLPGKRIILRLELDSASVVLTPAAPLKNYAMLYAANDSVDLAIVCHALTTSVSDSDSRYPAPINSRLNVVVRSPALFGLGRNDCWPSRGSQLPWALPFIFSLCCPLNDRRRAAHSIFKIGRLFSLFLFSCPTSSPPSFDER